jgi:hypothetical protein
MYSSMNLQETILVSANSVIQTLFAFIPRLVFASLVFLVGWLLGGMAKSLVRSALKAIKLDKLTKDSAVEKFLKRAEIRFKVEEIIGGIFRWIIIYIFLIASVNIIGLTTVSQFLTNLLSYLPRVISASIILALGILVAGLVESLVKSAIASVDPATGRLVGKVSSYAVVIFALLAAIGELGIAQSYINILLIGFVATLSIGLGLAFGLGAKDVVSEVLTHWYHQFNQDHQSKKKS